MNSDQPTELTKEDIDKAFDMLMNYEMKSNTCFKCSKKYYFDSYGQHLLECDECYFQCFPKEEREAFYRSFFE